MSGAEIGKALEAVGEAVRKALVKPPCCMEGTGCELPPCHCSQVAARAAIAAFLRALPDEFRAKVRFDSGNEDDVFFCEDWGLLAAAVEAAARKENKP